MKAPDKLFLSQYDYEISNGYPECCIHRWDETDIEYIRKDALLEWAKGVQKQETELLAAGYSDIYYNARIALIKEVIRKINSL